MNERYGQALLPYDPEMEELRKAYAAFEIGIAPAIVPEAWKFTRGRIVFPIRNAVGELVAFAARYQGDLPAKKIPKYINSSTSAIYKKDELLYGWYRAVSKVRETGIVFLTEGYKDTLAMHAAGFSNTVALCGTNLSEHSYRYDPERGRYGLSFSGCRRGGKGNGYGGNAQTAQCRSPGGGYITGRR